MTEEIKLNSSKLGTQEYWNEFYKRELQNFQSNNEDTGECWFDDSDAESKMIQFIVDKIDEGELADYTSFLDLGTGNGHLLFELSQELQDVDKDFTYHEIDYSAESIEFATNIASKKFPNSSFKFDQVDLLSDTPFLENKFDVLLDKGTLDAIALNQELSDGKRGMDIYASQVSKMMREGSILLVTSCNFTENELVKIITSGTELRKWDQIQYPSFQFGGVQGSTVVSVAFIK
ncbi:EFM4 [Candida theae]|uniref:Protein-lysine N-methyltransferase EFM4 n=1 Tax=Candida theae TaxID=1198502 RepID=A0AAD5BEL0_9ASCO|nr:EFM4 [Candida theae]KAI5958249.1 EFM4 [Candida theae]